MSQYPPLRITVLSGLVEIKKRLETEPEWLDSPDCPYEGDVRTILKDLLATKIVEKIVERNVGAGKPAARGRPSKDVELSEEDQALVRTEIKKMIAELNALDGKGLETNELIQITKTKSSLLESALKQQERAFNVKRMSEFKSVVMTILDDLVDESGRETFLKRLEPYR
jgi:hypothetical protein